MQRLATVRAQVSPMPRFQLFQQVWTYSADESNQGCFDRGVIVGVSLPQSDLDIRDWWYMVWRDEYPRIPMIAPLIDWVPESDIIPLE